MDLKPIPLYRALSKGLLNGARSFFEVETELFAVRSPRRTVYVSAHRVEIQDLGLRETSPWGMR